MPKVTLTLRQEVESRTRRSEKAFKELARIYMIKRNIKNIRQLADLLEPTVKYQHLVKMFRDGGHITIFDMIALSTVLKIPREEFAEAITK